MHPQEAQEGVIKFTTIRPSKKKLYFSHEVKAELAELNSWRKKLFSLDIIGCNIARYGACYGNVSMRYVVPGSGTFSFAKPKGFRTFLISGTQTGKLEGLTEEHYARIYHYDIRRNTVYAEGPLEPSSEAMTHGAVYDLPLDLGIRCVYHVHSPQLWRNAGSLGIPETSNAVAYGTPEMAEEVTRLFLEKHLGPCSIFSMSGHEDGIVAFGSNAQEAGELVLKYTERTK